MTCMLNGVKDCCIILKNSHEYRAANVEANNTGQPRIVSRFVGLIVIPGEHISKLEIQEFDPSGIV